MTEIRTIGVTFPSDRLPRKRQEEIVRAEGAAHMLHVGDVVCRSWRDLPRHTVPGDTVIVCALVLMPTARSRDSVSPADQLGEILADAIEAGFVILEALTGRRSDNREDRRKMIAEAARGIRGGGRQLPKGVFKRGRPAADCDAVVEEAKRIWHSPAYTTNADAIAHMPPCREPYTGKEIKWTFDMAYSRFKASGRPFPKRRR